MIGARVASADQVGPGRKAAKAAWMPSSIGSRAARWTSSREPETHTWPALPVMAAATLRAVRARSGASANTSCGLLPPSSRVTGLGPLSAQAVMMAVPVPVEPVKVTLPMRGWRHRASPVVRPSPWTTLRMPAGSPARTANSARRKMENGVSSDGLITTALPAASAGAIFQPAMLRGKFQGATAPTTP